MPIPQLRQANNGFYYIHWSEGRRSKRQSLGVKEEALATERFAQWLLVGNPNAEPTASLTVADMWSIYTDKHIVTADATRDFSWKNIEPFFGAKTCGEIDDEVVGQYVAKRTSGRLGRKARPSTVRRELVAMRSCINWCAHPKRKLLDPAAVPQFDLPESAEPRDRWLKDDEVQRLLAGAEALRRGDKLARVELFLWLALETAARKQAILELTWDRVDFETRVIHYNVPGRAQTKKRRADVPISAALLPVLQRAHAEWAKACEDAANDKTKKLKKPGPIVMGSNGPIWASVQWAAIKAGFSDQVTPHGKKPKATGVSPHVLRHTAATHMARRGVPLWIIAKILGNSLAMIEKTYAKHCPDDLRAAINEISQRPKTEK